jgi:ABC-type sulfate/molybdate transport systems ATPase subunit
MFEKQAWMQRAGEYPQTDPEYFALLARALAVEPAVLLMDEPFGSIDIDLKSSLIVMLQELLAGGTTTTVYVTHDLTEALQLADRIVELRPGGTLSEVDLSDRAAVARDWLAKFHIEA